MTIKITKADLECFGLGICYYKKSMILISLIFLDINISKSIDNDKQSKLNLDIN